MAAFSYSNKQRDQQEASKTGSAADSTSALDFDKMVSALPTTRGWTPFSELKQYRGYWFRDSVVPGILSVRENFRGRSDQIVIASFPKSGTTWLKALLFCITNRSSSYDFTASGVEQVDQVDSGNPNPLLSCNPHVCVPFLENYATAHLGDPNPDMALFGSHIPYSLLPESMIESGCKIVYVMRDPKAVYVSSWHFAVNVWKDAASVPLDDTFDMFCDGFVHCGSYWDHVVEYVKTSLKSPDTVFVIAYEDLIERPVYNVKRLANFIGHAFTIAEEDQGVVDGIVSFCSFDKLSNLEVNKTKASSIEGIPFAIPNDTFFRKAKIGDWRNYLDDEKRERIDGITYKKFKDIGALSRYMGST